MCSLGLCNCLHLCLKIKFNNNNNNWAAVVSRGWAKVSACRLQMTLSCAVLCHIVSLQYLSRSSLHRLAGPPCPTVLIISMACVLSLTQMLVFLSLYVMLSILLSILVCAAASLFCACLVSVLGPYS